MNWKQISAAALVTSAWLASGWAYAQDAPPPLQLYHLEPLGARGINFYRGFADFVKKVTPKKDHRAMSVYINTGVSPGTYLAMYEANDFKNTYLLYALDTKPSPTVTKIDVPGPFLGEVTRKLADIISGDTHYAAYSIPFLYCLGAKDYVFESLDTYGTATDCVTAGAARQLVHFADDLLGLAQMEKASRKQKLAKMKLILADIDAAMAVDQQPYSEANTKEICKKLHGEYLHWSGYPIAEGIKTSDGNMHGLIPSFGRATDLQIPQYRLPKSLRMVLAANEEGVGEFQVCSAPDAGELKAGEKNSLRVGWIKSFIPADSSTKASFVRKIRIVALDAASSVTNGFSLFRRIEVSFDYQDGVIENAKIEKAYKGVDDTAVLTAIAHASYPPTPANLKGLKLHIDLPIQLGMLDY